MEAYLDHSATTPALPEVAQLVCEIMTKDFGNPSSMHRKGFEAEKILKKAREDMAAIWKVSEQEVYFTSGGTESDSLAIMGCAKAQNRRGRHIITTAIEHAAVGSTVSELEKQGFEVTILGTDEKGFISLEELENAIRKDTILVSVMHVNNEIGTIEPVEKIGELIKRKNPDCLFHVDDIQGFGKLNLYPKKAKIDLLSVSGHKIHGPKGTGALYVSKDVRILPQILGGGQQKGMRSGTENVPGYAGFALAARLMYEKNGEHCAYLYGLRQAFVKKLLTLENVRVNGSLGGVSGESDLVPDGETAMEMGLCAPHIVSFSAEGVRSEVLLHALEDKGIYVSAGSACASNKPAVSATLQAIDLPKNLLDSTIRFSFCPMTTEEELNYAFEALSSLLPMLRKFTRR